MQQVPVRRRLTSDLLVDRFRSLCNRAFLSSFPSSLGRLRIPGSFALFAGLALSGAMLLSGCGSIASNVLVVSPGILSFGTVSVGQSSSETVTLTNTGNSAIEILQLNVAGQSFSLSGSTLPITIAGQSSTTVQVQFSPASAGSATGQLTVEANASSGTSVIVQLSGTGTQASSTTAVGVLSGLSCANTSVTGSETDTCTVTLSAAAGNGGLNVNLSSSSTAVTVPASVAIPAGATSATFAAAVAAVATAQAVTLTAGANGADVSMSLQLNAGTSVPMLSVNATTVAFGDVLVNTPATQTVTLTSTGTAPLMISAATLTGTGFSGSGFTLPVTLNPGQTVTVALQFDPLAAGAETGELTVTSNSSPGGLTVISLSGTGVTVAYQVNLTWDAPGTSSDPVAGYNVYRSAGNAAYQLLNSSVLHATTYIDNGTQSGVTYSYYVESVDAEGNQSGPSNVYTATIP